MRSDSLAPGAALKVLRYALMAGLWALSPSAPADSAGEAVGALSLHYQAYVAGAPVGEASVDITVDNGRYQVSGDAVSNGWIKGFTSWRNRFGAEGNLSGPVADPAEFVYTETDRNKHRHVVVRDGKLQVTKNGRKRPQRPSPHGADVVSALFVQPECHDEQVIHTGRHVYRLARLPWEGDGCRYSVTDDDDDTFEIDVELVQRGDLRVPKRITVRAWLTGWVELTRAEHR